VHGGRDIAVEVGRGEGVVFVEVRDAGEGSRSNTTHAWSEAGVGSRLTLWLPVAEPLLDGGRDDAGEGEDQP
jgi:hypothetical protein